MFVQKSLLGRLQHASKARTSYLAAIKYTIGTSTTELLLHQNK